VGEGEERKRERERKIERERESVCERRVFAAVPPTYKHFPTLFYTHIYILI